MEIKLHNLLPIPLKELNYSASEIWGHENITFQESKRYLLKSESGKGKTTLLSIIFGLRKDYEGSISIDNKYLTNFSLLNWTNLRREKISYVFQGLELFLELTVYENIIIKNKLTKHKSKTEIEKFAELLQITDLMHRKINKISFGQKQRVAIIRALCQPFNFIILDEPFSHLDENNMKNAAQLIEQEANKQKAGIIYTSHDTDYNLTYDRIYNI